MISKRIGTYMKERGFNLSEVSRRTGVNYASLYSSLYDNDSERDLRAEELVPLCIFLNIDPRDFADNGVGGEKHEVV